MSTSAGLSCSEAQVWPHLGVLRQREVSSYHYLVRVVQSRRMWLIRDTNISLLSSGGEWYIVFTLKVSLYISVMCVER